MDKQITQHVEPVKKSNKGRKKLAEGTSKTTILAKNAASMRYGDEALSINQRFFSALHTLIEKKVIKSKYEFTKEFKLNPGNFYTLEKKPKTISLPPLYLFFLVDTYRVSAHWLLTGEGEMMMH